MLRTMLRHPPASTHRPQTRRACTPSVDRLYLGSFAHLGIPALVIGAVCACICASSLPAQQTPPSAPPANKPTPAGAPGTTPPAKPGTTPPAKPVTTPPAKPATPAADPAKPATPPGFEIDIPRDPFVDGPKGVRPPDGKGAAEPAKKPSAFQVADALEPKALEIITRGTTVAGELKTIALVSSGRIEGGDPTGIPPGFGDPHEVTLEYIHTDAYSLPRMRISPVASGGVVVFTHNGSRGLLVDNGARIYRETRSDWPTVAPFAWGAIPAWLTNERQLARAAGRTSNQIELRPVIVAAQVAATETIDGVECDVVRIVKSRDVYADDAGDGKPGIVDVQRVFFEIAYARTDGFPRRVIQQQDAEGAPRTTHEFRSVRVGDKIDAAMFSATPPEGYTNAAPPAPAKNPQPGAGAAAPAKAPTP
ncbi:MAG: hypothetical protein RL354_2150 [Planctomycetota bacterium]